MPKSNAAISYDAETNHTKKAYVGLADAYEFFNARLFEGKLPSCVITMTKQKKSVGYYSHNRFRHSETTTDEIALNPLTFEREGITGTLQTLVHEMVHLWQQHLGKPPKKAYHNKEWADKMELIGLQPSHTGLPGGKRIGPKMSDYVKDDGQFKLVCGEFTASYELSLYQYLDNVANSDAKKASKTKFSCVFCGLNAWAKKSAQLRCDNCDIKMVCETTEDDNGED